MSIIEDVVSLTDESRHDHQQDDDEESILPLTQEELYQELNELLSAFCSDAQQQFCMDQNIIQPDNLYRLRQTVQQIQLLLPTVDRTNNLQLRQALMRVIHDILHYYGSMVNHKTNATVTSSSPSLNRRSLAPSSTSPLSASTSPSTTTTMSTSRTMSSTAEEILTSILTTFDYPPGAYTVVIDKHNYGQLGLQHGKIGTRQIIFDHRQLSTNDAIDMINQICDIFAALFASTAQHHLAQIDSQIRKSQPFHTLSHIKRLSTRIFEDTSLITCMDDADMDQEDNFIDTNHHDHQEYLDHQSQHYNQNQRHHRRQSTTNEILHTTSNISSSSTNHQTSSPMTILTPFRLSMTPTHTLWRHPIPIPSFAPAPWQLPDLLKKRHPYNPLFFGLFRRRTSNNQTKKKNQSSSFLKHLQPQHLQHYHHQQHQQHPCHHHHHHHHPQQHQHQHQHHHHQHRNQVTRTTSALKGKVEGQQQQCCETASNPTLSTSCTTSTTKNNINNNSRTNITSANATTPTPAVSDCYACHSAMLLDEGIDNSTHQHHHLQPSTTMSTSVPLRRYQSKRRGRGTMGKSTTLDTAISSSSMEEEQVNHQAVDDMYDMYDSNTTLEAPFISVSVDKLAFHLGKIAGQFYQDLLMHTRLRYQETQSTLQTLEWQLMDLYRHLQLASSRAVMQRALMIVQELDERQHDSPCFQQQQKQQQQQQQQHHHHHQLQQQLNRFGQIGRQQYNNGDGGQEEDDDSSEGDAIHQHHQQEENDQGQHTAAQQRKSMNQWVPICTDHYQKKDMAFNNNNNKDADDELSGWKLIPSSPLMTSVTAATTTPTPTTTTSTRTTSLNETLNDMKTLHHALPITSKVATNSASTLNNNSSNI
ncbi:uncharacterized protein BX664DRAFT_317025 [Halteromyces radiatus]|uniref:uncharacterized protein n=1 Tax=Halteromyces radiatus TaxID=101107 RepID=UPI0022207D7A|nr:uncharacterized protein BX664DRAFT_317025 [Halteromyces radiatus]KAI8083023.1 hypothetical protein BX664DRAFT_317025 [Halteromyces radiatus]